ncbi:exodeoxyribonuclease V subunit beta [Caldimonas tepidiphila]|uniref:exodeoxyribonuclease V subunit beta n=1 Tax=Caldimonas tepidiphila TaxID=2315841 RepID=UPI000E5BA807|nr:exodeoxyribonuclease V subunit beta [Caldimonas tepidiphila]
MTLPTSLDPLTFPLHGSRLIEASAGTGKTFTIAALYLRLVLGHGGDEAAFKRALTPPEILVVTFTDAATKELRDRIRARLAEAAVYFQADPSQVVPREAGEDLLHDLRAGYAPGDWPGCARKLQLAAEWMDEAAVSTIHAWCHRMLREHAFDSDSLFTQRLETDPQDLLAEVVRDYWRSFMYPLDAEAARQVHKWWPTPEKLQEAIRKLLPHAGLLAGSPEPAAAFMAANAQKQQALAALKAPWTEWLKNLEMTVEDWCKKGKVDKGHLKSNFRSSAFKALSEWRDDPAAVQPALSDKAWERFTPEGIAEVWTSGDPVGEHLALAAIRDLKAALKVLPNAREDVLRHAACWVAERFTQEQERRAQMGFDDLLARLDTALAGPNGARLAAVIRAQFPVALIDEFQDTDAVQYRIFDTVYRVRDNDPATALILIGDPKQAIYAFRGADIHTYIAARADTVGRLYTLRRNFRSTHAMVAASNRCFRMAERQVGGPGAFLFREPGGNNPVPFRPASAQGRKDELRAEGALVPALTVWRLPSPNGKPLAKKDHLETMSSICASEMVRLLTLGQQGKAGFVGEGALLRPLRPADMAVLVRNREEADAIRRALASRGVRSIYLSERESVYQRPEAFDLQLWLNACADPDSPRSVRAALATRTLGLDWGAIERLNHDEAAWDERVMQFRGYRDCWRRRGVLPMLRQMLHDFHVPSRLLAEGGSGERSLTDLLHLAELLQQASSLLEGEHALIRHLAEQRREDAEAGSDERQLRLESDADLVQVVTVHKSKGLEYPLVFLPFACAFRATKASDLPLKWHDDKGKLQLGLADKGNCLERADRERLAEDLRKFYVALTRARYATWIGTAPVNGVERSALGHLVSGDLRSGIDRLARRRGYIAVIDDPRSCDDRYDVKGAAAVRGPALVPGRALRDDWWIASYSALRKMDKRVAATAHEDVFKETAIVDEDAAGQGGRAVPSPYSSGPLHGFPRGAAAGSFFHELLEWAAEQGFGRIAGSPGQLRDAVARRCAKRGWQRWIEPVCEWMQGFLQQSFVPPGAGAPFTLAGLSSPVAEMEFLIAVHDADLAKLDTLVSRHTLGGAPRPQLLPGQLNGMLKGFIDLVFEHEGRYYVIDYKSNRLGADDAAYTPEAMKQEVLSRRYELQYVLYLLALHRLLKLRLPDYDYERHIGGAIYLFLRGSHAPGMGVHAERPPRELIESLDRLIARRTAKEPA